MSIKNKILKQYNLGPWLGGAKDLFGRTMMYVSFMTFSWMAMTSYETDLVRSYILNPFPWVTFKVYFGGAMAIIILLLLLEWKLIIPSTYTFLNKQEYQHRNLIKEQLDRMEQEGKEQLDRIEKRLDEIEKKTL